MSINLRLRWVGQQNHGAGGATLLPLALERSPGGSRLEVTPDSQYVGKYKRTAYIERVLGMEGLGSPSAVPCSTGGPPDVCVRPPQTQLQFATPSSSLAVGL